MIVMKNVPTPLFQYKILEYGFVRVSQSHTGSQRRMIRLSLCRSIDSSRQAAIAAAAAAPVSRYAGRAGGRAGGQEAGRAVSGLFRSAGALTCVCPRAAVPCCLERSTDDDDGLMMDTDAAYKKQVYCSIWFQSASSEFGAIVLLYCLIKCTILEGK